MRTVRFFRARKNIAKKATIPIESMGSKVNYLARQEVVVGIDIEPVVAHLCCLMTKLLKRRRKSHYLMRLRLLRYFSLEKHYLFVLD